MTRDEFIIQNAGKLTAEDIGKALGITRGAVSFRAARLKVSLRVPGRMSETIAKWHASRRRKPEPAINANQLWRITSR